jgi:transposase
MIKAISGLYVDRTKILNRIEALGQFPEECTRIPMDSLKRIFEKLNEEIASIEKKVKEFMNKEEYIEQYTRLTSVPGIGERTASSLVSYFNKFERFDSAKTVASYIGLTLFIKESGKSIKSKGIQYQRLVIHI